MVAPATAKVHEETDRADEASSSTLGMPRHLRDFLADLSAFRTRRVPNTTAQENRSEDAEPTLIISPNLKNDMAPSDADAFTPSDADAFAQAAALSLEPRSELSSPERPLQSFVSKAQYGVAATGAEQSSYALQEWEGYVVEVGGETFTARLLDITAGSKVEGEIAEFALSEVPGHDEDLLRVGAVFRWIIGHLRTKGGTRWNVSQIVFRRLPQWKSRDIEDANRRAEALSAALKWE